MKKCSQPGCEACPFILPGKEVISPFSAADVKINTSSDCNSKNIVYSLFCSKDYWKQIYVGKTEEKNWRKDLQNIGPSKKKWKNVVGVHFNGPGHNLENLKISAIEKVFNVGQETFLKREALI